MSFLYSYYLVQPYLLSFFFNDPATTDIYTLSLHDALPICKVAIKVLKPELAAALGPERFLQEIEIAAGLTHPRSEEHTSELQSPDHLVCRLLLEKKKKKKQKHI